MLSGVVVEADRIVAFYKLFGWEHGYTGNRGIIDHVEAVEISSTAACSHWILY